MNKFRYQVYDGKTVVAQVLTRFAALTVAKALHAALGGRFTVRDMSGNLIKSSNIEDDVEPKA